ncbi:hypothetical protein C8J57DRAFT_1347176 [Mycena rebaudengoi]|nr:hypothetical protein C8J57DRAFT_1347176 [Mycena rebaudengoi]
MCKIRGSAWAASARGFLILPSVPAWFRPWLRLGSYSSTCHYFATVLLSSSLISWIFSNQLL